MCPLLFLPSAGWALLTAREHVGFCSGSWIWVRVFHSYSLKSVLFFPDKTWKDRVEFKIAMVPVMD